MNCGTNDSRVDFFAFNDYSWCNPSTFKTSTWSDKVDAFKDYSIPILYVEQPYLSYALMPHFS